MSLTCPISLSYISVSRFIIRSGGQSTRFKAEFAYTVTSPLSLLLARIYCYLLLFLIFAQICSDFCSSFFSILYFSKTLYKQLVSLLIIVSLLQKIFYVIFVQENQKEVSL